MAIIDSILRKKKWVMAERTRCYLEAVSACEKARQSFEAAARLHADAQSYLWEQLADEEALCVQRLTAAKQQEHRRGAELREARALHDCAAATVNTLRQALVRLQKDIEKLEEKRDERRRRSAQEAQNREWARQDEWTTTQHGAGGL